MAIANHEQRKILQPLIYDELSFQITLKIQAGLEWLCFVPARVAALSSACDVDNPELRIKMEEGDLYDENDRMKFITDIANQYHKIIGKDNDYMEDEIRTISTWENAQ